MCELLVAITGFVYIQNRLFMYSSLEKVEYIIWYCQVTRLHSRMTWLLDQHSLSWTSIFVPPVAPYISSTSLENSRRNWLIQSTLLIALFLEVSLLYIFLIYDRIFQMVLVPVLDIISFVIQNVFIRILCSGFRAWFIYINNCPTRCSTKQSICYSASSLYMFRMSTTPIIRSSQNSNCSLRYCSYFLCI